MYQLGVSYTCRQIWIYRGKNLYSRMIFKILSCLPAWTIGISSLSIFISTVATEIRVTHQNVLDLYHIAYTVNFLYIIKMFISLCLWYNRCAKIITWMILKTVTMCIMSLQVATSRDYIFIIILKFTKIFLLLLIQKPIPLPIFVISILKLFIRVLIFLLVLFFSQKSWLGIFQLAHLPGLLDLASNPAW
jgi:hypothetical protein